MPGRADPGPIACDGGGANPADDRAQGLHVFEHKVIEAEADLLQALREKPKWVPAHMGLVMLYAGISVWLLAAISFVVFGPVRKPACD